MPRLCLSRKRNLLANDGSSATSDSLRSEAVERMMAQTREDIREGRPVSMGFIGNLLADLEHERQQSRRLRGELGKVKCAGRHSPGDYPYTCLGCRLKVILDGVEV